MPPPPLASSSPPASHNPTSRVQVMASVSLAPSPRAAMDMGLSPQAPASPTAHAPGVGGVSGSRKRPRSAEPPASLPLPLPLPLLEQRRSLLSLALQLKLKTLLVEAWASDGNAVVVERNLFAAARELAQLFARGALEQPTCLKFLELAHARLAALLEGRDALRVQPLPMWNTAVVQAAQLAQQESDQQQDAPPSPLSVADFSADASQGAASPEQRELAVLWKAMSVARDRGAQLWHENKPEQALPFLLAADSYMKRFTLKHQRLQIDRALLEALEPEAAARYPASSPATGRKRVTFADEPEVVGVADASLDRSTIAPTKPSKLESLLLRTAREFPTPSF